MLTKILPLLFCLTFSSGIPQIPKLNDQNNDDENHIPRIVGGEEAAPGEFPYIVTIERDGLLGRTLVCGGSIVNNNYILTSASCLGGQPSNFYIVGGEHDLSIDSGNEQIILAEQFIEHEHYDAQTHTNDIALIRLSTPFNFTELIGPVQLPQQLGLISIGVNCTTAGWGTTTEGGVHPNTLRKVTIPTVSDDDCRNSYGLTKIDERMLCAGLMDGGKDSCEGDGGGPLMCDGNIHGISSWGMGCARPNYPGVYTEVAFYRNWIDTNAV